MKRYLVRRLVISGVTATLLSGALPATAAFADPLCNVNQATWVRYGPGTSYDVMYTIDGGGGFRIDGPATVTGWIIGHGNGHSSGWIPNDGRLYNCH